jgi:uncharacterized protein (UPF0261 family)
MAAVLLIGTLDTKGCEIAYVRDRLAAHGAAAAVLDAGVFGCGSLHADVTSREVAAAGGEEVDVLQAAADRGAAVEVMARGAATIAARLYAEGRIGGVMGVGGSGGAVIATRAMRALPLGVPKLLVSPVASGDTTPYVGESDITLAHPVVDLAGLNRISRPVLDNVAAAMAAMVRASAERVAVGEDARVVAATMFGITTPCVAAARAALERAKYEVVVFSANGAGGRALESLVASGAVHAVLDLTTTELADELVGGIRSAGRDRLGAAARAGVPLVVSLGAIEVVNFGPLDTVPKRFRERLLVRHNDAVTLMRTTAAESAELGALLARKLNAASGPCCVLVPRRGFSTLSVAGGVFHDPVADEALVGALRAGLDARVELVELDLDINDPRFAAAAAERLRTLDESGEAYGTRRRAGTASTADRVR